MNIIDAIHKEYIEAQFMHYACTDMFDGKVERDDRTYNCFYHYGIPNKVPHGYEYILQ